MESFFLWRRSSGTSVLWNVVHCPKESINTWRRLALSSVAWLALLSCCSPMAFIYKWCQNLFGIIGIFYQYNLFFLKKEIIYWFFERERERERNFDLLFHPHTRSLVYSCVGLDQEIELSTLVHRYDAPTNWATRPGYQHKLLSDTGNNETI